MTGGEIVVLVAVLAALVLVELDVARSLSLTYDERAHIGAGFSYVHHGEVLLNPEHPPLVKVLSGAALGLAGVHEGSAAEPYERAHSAPQTAIFEQWAYGTRLIFHDNENVSLPFSAPGARSVMLAARAPMIVFPLLLLLFIFLWARSLWGVRGAWLALAVAATYPDLLGHGALVTTDVPLAAFAVAAGYALAGLMRGGGMARLVLFGIAVGGAVATKFSGPILVAAFAVAAMVGTMRSRDPAAAGLTHPFGRGTAAIRMMRLASAAAIVAGLALVMLVVVYFGNNPLSSYRSGLASVAANHSPDARALCLGRYAVWFWYYFPVVTALKLPLGTLALFALTAFVTLHARRDVVAELVVHLPAVVLLVATTWIAPQIGSRYVLPVVSLCIVSAGRLAPWAAASRPRWALIACALVASFVHVVREHPFHTSSTNWLAGASRLIYRVMDDSNQDWGQGLEALAAWQRAHAAPAIAVVPRFPATEDAELAAYGVDGRVVPREQPVLFLPRPGIIYAVSPHLVAWGRRTEMELAAKPQPPGMVAPRLALGGVREPEEIVGGGYLIFDLRRP